MKLYKWLYGAMALTLLGACSDRDFIDDENAAMNGNNANNSTTEGYLAVEIRLPQESSTRAEDEGAKNEQYGDGTPAEYRVENALIALFKGDSEKDAVFYRAQDLQKPFFTNLPADDPVAASYIAAIQVQKPLTEEETLWALVILNRNGDSTNVTTNEDGDVVFKLAGKDIVAGKTKFSEIKQYTTNNSFIGKDGKSQFFMINAPMSAKKAGEAVADGDITYLTNLGNTVYDTPEEAKTNVAGCVYVERAVSKVTCKSLANDALRLTIMDENGEEVDLSKDGWSVTASVKYALSNTSNDSYVLRNVDFSSDTHFSWDMAYNNRYRMLGNTPIPALSNPFHQEVKNLYRTYWCRDPHYDKAMTPDNKTVVTKTEDFKDISTTLYCKENTFQVKHQNYNSTTLAIFEVDFTIKKGNTEYENLYVRDGNNTKIYLSRVSAYADGITRIIRDLNVQNAIKAALPTGKTLPTGFSVKDHLDITITAEADEDTGVKYLVVKDVKLKFSDRDKADGLFDDNSKAKFDASLASNKQTLLDGVNALTDVTVYEGGKCYYTVPVKHFGDYYTPWNKDNVKGVTTNEVYNEGKSDWNNPEHSQKYLGRYGMVRNNWYELNISKISALGESVIPDSNIDLSDDNNEDKKYFAVEIHILSWAKRLQNIEL